MTMPVEELRQLLVRQMRSGDDGKMQSWMQLRHQYLIMRAEELRACDTDPVYRAMVKEMCKKSFWYFARTFGFVHEPRKNIATGSGRIPFIPYIHQEWVATFLFELIEESPGLGLIMKVREVGVSWIVYLAIVWMWLYTEDFSAILGSMTQDAVDLSAGRLNDNTMFGRIEIIVSSLPIWLRPNLDWEDKAQRQSLWWRNPNNGNTLYGRSATGKVGRQDRATLAFLDEFDHWEDPLGAITSIQDSAGAVLLVTTPEIKGDSVGRRIMEETEAKVMEIPADWHPLKTSEWVGGQRRIRLAESFASEVEMSFDGATTGMIYPEWARVAKGEFPYRPDWPMYGGIDFGRSDGTGIVYLQRSPLTARIRLLASYYKVGETIEHFFPFMGGSMLSHHSDYSADDLHLIELSRLWHRGRFGVEWFGDPAGRQKTAVSNRSVLDMLAEQRIHVTTNMRATSHEDRQAATHTLLRNAECNIALCKVLDWSMKGYKRAGSSNSAADRRNKPLHNRRSHVPAALEYAAVNLPAIKVDKDEKKPARRRAAWE